MKIVRGLVLECFKSSILVPPPSTFLSSIFSNRPLLSSFPSFLPFFLLFFSFLLFFFFRLAGSVHHVFYMDESWKKRTTKNTGPRLMEIGCIYPFCVLASIFPLVTFPLFFPPPHLASKNVPPLIKYLFANIFCAKISRRRK